MIEKYIRQSMWNRFNVLIDRGQNTHREICECSVLCFCFWTKTQNFPSFGVLRFAGCKGLIDPVAVFGVNSFLDS